jgi:ABC-type sugar transport system permease subunit
MKNNHTVHTKLHGKRLAFYICLMAFPVAQFAVFYVGANLNSIVIAFQKWDFAAGAYRFAGFENFKTLISSLRYENLFKTALKNSFLLYGVGLLVGVALGLLFSFYIYKKMPMGGFFKVMLFMPSILSTIVMVVLFQYFTERAIPGLWYALTKTDIEGFLSRGGNSQMITLIFFTVWYGFGPSVLMYLGAMNNISVSVVESARLEGANSFQEFAHITLPMIFPTFVTFVTVGVAGIFTNQLNLFSFYGTVAEARTYTVGYYLYRGANMGSLSEFPGLSAFGLLLTAVVAPATLGVKALLEKLGPKTY